MHRFIFRFYKKKRGMIQGVELKSDIIKNVKTMIYTKMVLVFLYYTIEDTCKILWLYTNATHREKVEKFI